MIGKLGALYLSSEAFGELAIVATDARDLVLLLGDEFEQPAWRDNLSVDGERSIMLDVTLLGKLLDIGAVVHDAPAILLGADLFGVARRLSLADSEQASDVFDLDIDRCLVRFHDERV